MKLMTRQDLGLALIRFAVGATFIAHGSQKLFQYGIPGVAGGFAQMGIPMPMLSATLATAAEFGCGILLLAGLFTRLAAVPIAITMLVAMLKVHLKGGFFLPTGFEYTFVLLAASVGLAFAGGGAFALDNVISKRSSTPSKSSSEPRDAMKSVGIRTA